MTQPRGKHPFEYQAPDGEQIRKIADVRDMCKALYHHLIDILPPSVERSEAIRRLEEVSMWANKGIVMYDPPVDEYVRPNSTWPR